ncbi:MAG: DMT family transporter [Oscillibacter sp.]|nr:DMT family transporter [Oscillibacter sp.]
MHPKYQGILFILLSAFCFAWMTVCVRMSGDVPTLQKSFFRNLIAAGVAAVMLVRQGGSFRPASRGNLPYLIGRALCGTVGILGNFYAVDHLLLSDASMLNKMSPFFAVLASIVLLKEKLAPVQIAALAGAFGGALCIIKPTFSNMNLLASLVGFAGGMGAGIAYTLVRMLGQRGEKSSYIVFFFSSFSCLLALPYVLLAGAPMTVSQTLWLVGAGLAAAGGQFTITAAYRCAPAREISVFDYSQVIFSAIIGFLLFGDRPDELSILGYFIICAMAVLNFWYNNHHKTP